MAAFGRETGVRYSALTALKRSSQETTAAICRRVEAALGLPRNWMDEQRAALSEDVVQLVRAKTRKPGVREDSPEMTALRIGNVEWLVGSSFGAKAAFTATVGWHASEFYQMKGRTLGGKRAHSIETRLGLPEGWLDIEHDHSQELPEAFEDRLALLRHRAELTQPAAPRTPGAASPALAAELPLLARVESPVTRALIEKLLVVGSRNLLPESRALEMLNEVVALER